MSNNEYVDKLKRCTKLQVKKSQIGGYGVFAAKDIKEGDILEEAIFVRTGYRSKELMHDELRQILYTYPCDCDDCKYRGRYLVLASGFINLYNHSEPPDVKFDWFLKKRFIRVSAIRDIEKGTEVFHNYGPDYGKRLMKEVKV